MELFFATQTWISPSSSQEDKPKNDRNVSRHNSFTLKKTSIFSFSESVCRAGRPRQRAGLSGVKGQPCPGVRVCSAVCRWYVQSPSGGPGCADQQRTAAEKPAGGERRASGQTARTLQSLLHTRRRENPDRPWSISISSCLTVSVCLICLYNHLHRYSPPLRDECLLPNVFITSMIVNLFPVHVKLVCMHQFKEPVLFV